MSPPSTGAQDAAVAVLQTQQITLERAVSDLSTRVAEGFSSIDAKLDRLNELTTTLARIAAQQEQHSDGLRRAFGEIQTLTAEVGSLRRQIHLARGVTIGATLLGGSILGVVLWVSDGFIAEHRDNRDRIHQLELLNERHHPGRTT